MLIFPMVCWKFIKTGDEGFVNYNLVYGNFRNDSTF